MMLLYLICKMDLKVIELNGFESLFKSIMTYLSFLIICYYIYISEGLISILGIEQIE